LQQIIWNVDFIAVPRRVWFSKGQPLALRDILLQHNASCRDGVLNERRGIPISQSGARKHSGKNAADEKFHLDYLFD